MTKGIGASEIHIFMGFTSFIGVTVTKLEYMYCGQSLPRRRCKPREAPRTYSPTLTRSPLSLQTLKVQWKAAMMIAR